MYKSQPSLEVTSCNKGWGFASVLQMSVYGVPWIAPQRITLVLILLLSTENLSFAGCVLSPSIEHDAYNKPRYTGGHSNAKVISTDNLNSSFPGRW